MYIASVAPHPVLACFPLGISLRFGLLGAGGAGAGIEILSQCSETVGDGFLDQSLSLCINDEHRFHSTWAHDLPQHTYIGCIGIICNGIDITVWSTRRNNVKMNNGTK